MPSEGTPSGQVPGMDHGLGPVPELPPESEGLAPVPELTPLKKGPLPSGGLKPVRKAGGTIRRLAAARANLTPEARRRLRLGLGISVMLALGTVGGFLYWAKPWVPNDPPPVRSAAEVGPEGLRARAIKWATENEDIQAREFLNAVMDEKSAKKAIEEGAVEGAVKRARGSVKEHGLPRALTLFGQIGLTEKLVVDVRERSNAGNTWLELLAASKLVLDIEAHDHLPERYARNNGPIVEDRIIGVAARKKSQNKHYDAAVSDMATIAAVLEFRGAWELYRQLSSSYSNPRENWELRVKEARERDAYRD